MVLTKERAGQIAMQALQMKMEADGIRLNPKELKRHIHNEAKEIGVTTQELAELAKLIYRGAFEKTMAVLEEISPSAKVEDKEQAIDRLRGSS